jgi:hypothetical protein
MYFNIFNAVNLNITPPILKPPEAHSAACCNVKCCLWC